MPPEADPLQQQVLDHSDGPLLVTGRPGTGKTWALLERFALLIEGGADPERVALVSGSATARRSAYDALFERLGASLSSLNVLNIQALAGRFIADRLPQLDYEGTPVFLTAPEQFALVKDLLKGGGKERWKAYGETMVHLDGFADEVRDFIRRAQEAMLEPEDIRQKAKARDLPGWLGLADFYAEYLEITYAQGKIDSAGQVKQAALVAGQGEPLFDHVLVDDYQDATRSAEQLLIRMNAGSLVVAGDPGSHIFSFQGSTDAPIREFSDRTGAAHIELAKHHRGAEVEEQAWLAAHSSEENAMIARELRRTHVEEGVHWRDMAVVTRRQDGRFAAILRALDDARVPRRVTESWSALTAEPGALPYVLALRWLANADERDGLAETLLTSDLVRLSPAAARGLVRAARIDGLPPQAALERSEGLTEDEAVAVAGLHTVLAEADGAASRSVRDTFALLWRELACSARLVAAAETDPSAARDLDAALAFSRTIAKASEAGEVSVAAFLGAIDDREGPGFPADGRGDTNGVRVLTAHSTVGTEFDTVFVAGAAEGDFPSLTRPEKMFDLRVLDKVIPQSERNRLRLQDERRLFDVVVGRARRRVIMTTSDNHSEDAPVTARSRFVDPGSWSRRTPGQPNGEPISVEEAVAAWRRALAHKEVPAAKRLAALEGLIALGEDPGRWWFQRDWSGREGLLEEGQIHTSYSQLDSLEKCALAFVLSNKLGLETRDSHSSYYAWVGKLVHSLIEDVEGERVPRSVKGLTAAADERWDQSQFPSRAVSEEYRKLVKGTMLPNWVHNYADKPAAGAEKWFTFEHDGAIIRGAIDRIAPMESGGYRITDYKTGKPEYAGHPERSLQLGIYWLAVNVAETLAEFRPVRRVELAYLKGDYKGRFAAAPYQPSGAHRDDFLEDTKATLSELLTQLRGHYETGVFRPNTAAECRFCEFKPLCSLHPEGVQLFPVQEASS